MLVHQWRVHRRTQAGVQEDGDIRQIGHIGIENISLRPRAPKHPHVYYCTHLDYHTPSSARTEGTVRYTVVLCNVFSVARPSELLTHSPPAIDPDYVDNSSSIGRWPLERTQNAALSQASCRRRSRHGASAETADNMPIACHFMYDCVQGHNAASSSDTKIPM